MLSSDFILHFSVLEDPRVCNHNTRHKFLDILTLGFIANLCGCDDWVEVSEFCEAKQELFEQFLELPNGIPSHDTFGRVFSMIDTEHFEELFSEWMRKIFNKTKGEIIAIDGKTVRGSRAKGDKKGIHIVSAWACANKLTLGSVKVRDKSNEITAIPKLLKLLNITNCTITIDAMGCQKEIAREIIKRGADYVLCVKDNQKQLKFDIATMFDIADTRKYKGYIDSGKNVEKKHGREENRQYYTLPLDSQPLIKDDWPGAKSATKVIRTRIVDDEKTEEINYYISSHSYISDYIKKAIRAHWNVENCLHWQLDVSFNEDKCRARIKNEAESIALLRKMSLAFLKKDKTTKAGIKCRRKKASWDEKYLIKVLIEGSQDEKVTCEQ